MNALARPTATVLLLTCAAFAAAQGNPRLRYYYQPEQAAEARPGPRPMLIPAPLPAAPAPALPSPKLDLPAPLIAAPEVFKDGKLPTGVLLDQLGEQERYSLHGKEADKRACYAAVGAEGLIDDSAKPTVSVIDADAQRRKDLIAKVKAEFGDKVRTWEGGPDDWSFKPGFVATGNPTVYCQAPDGTVLHHQDGLDGGPEALIAAVRKAVPDYKPAADPDLRKPTFSLPDLDKLLADHAGIVAVVLAGGVVFLLLRK